MAGEATLRVPVGRPGAYRLDFDIATVRPEGRTLQLTCSGQQHSLPLVAVGADSTAPIRCDTDSDEILLQLQTEPVRLPEGGRALGVSFLDVRATALDTDDRLLFRLAAGLTVFGAVAGTGFGVAALDGRRWWLGIIAGASVLLAWVVVIEARPEYAPATVVGPGGLITLLAGLAAWLLTRGRRQQPLALAAAAILTGLLWTQPAAIRILPAIWAREEIDALRVLPWLAIFGLVCAALLGGRRSGWLAGAATLLAAVTCFLTPLAARAGERWLIEVDAPDWTNRAGITGALYVLAAFLLGGLALLVARQGERRPIARCALAGALAIAALLLWRVEIMKFNGDEPHYYVTARSIATDRDLELLDDYLDPHYAGITYSPVGNVAVERDASIIRYAGAAPAGEGSWFLIPQLPEGWAASDDSSGLLPATVTPPRIEGPDGGLAIPPPLTPAPSQAILVEGPCVIDAVTIGVPSGQSRQVRVSIHDAGGALLWDMEGGITAPFHPVAIPTSAGLCRGLGPWTIRADAADGEIVAVVLDRYGGLQFAGGDLHRSWVFGGLPRDRYGSVNVDARLLLHNPSTEIVQVTIRQITASDQTVSEITVGIAPGQTLVEPLPVFGANALAVLVTQDVQIAAGLYGIVEGTRYRMPRAYPAESLTVTIPVDTKHDAGVWLTAFNPSWMTDQFVIDDGERQESLIVCSNCAAVHLLEAGDAERAVSVRAASGEPLIYALVAYQERTGALHFDLPLPLAAAPLTIFDVAWPVLFVPALAGLAMVPALASLLGSVGLERRTAATMAALALLLAPFSTYAVRFYTEIVAAALLLLALVLWERALRSNRAALGVLAIGLFLPLLHGRLTLLAAGVLALALYAAIAHNRERIAGLPRRTLMLAGAGLLIGIALCALVVLQFAVSLESRDVAKFFRLTWVLPNSVGMLLDRGSGVLPFAPWTLFALAAPRPLHRTQRAALALAIAYYALLALRAGGWQTWGSPIRYLLPVIPLVALLAIPGLVSWWRSEQVWRRAAVALALGWSTGVTMLLHWIPLSGYVERTATGNIYLIDDALAWLPFPSPFRYMPTIEALPGPDWSEPLAIAITLLFAAAALWAIWPLVRDLLQPHSAAPEAARHPEKVR